jgi:hypothetical protein
MERRAGRPAAEGGTTAMAGRQGSVNTVSGITVPIKADATHIARTARIIAKHLTAMADELETPFPREIAADQLAKLREAYGRGRDDEAADYPIRCMACGRLAGMPTEPCPACP